MKHGSTFNYADGALAFLESLIDQDGQFATATDIFEWILTRSPEAGDAFLRSPIVFHRLPILFPDGMRDLAFYYTIQEPSTFTNFHWTFNVFRIEYEDETPLPGRKMKVHRD